MKKLLLIFLLLLPLLLCLPQKAAAEEQPPTRVTYRFVNPTGYDKTMLSVEALHADGSVFRIGNYVMQLSYYPTLEGETAEQSLYVGIPYENTIGMNVYIDTAAYGFVPKQGVDYTFSLTLWKNGTDMFYKTKPVSGVVCDFVPKVQAVGKPAQKIMASAKDGGFINTTDSPNLGLDAAVTTLRLELTLDGIPLAVPEDADWLLFVQSSEGNSILQLNPAVSRPDLGLYSFEPCLMNVHTRFVPVQGSVYTVQLQIQSGNKVLYYSTPVEGITCDFAPIVPNLGLDKNSILEISPLDTGISNIKIGGRETTVLQMTVRNLQGASKVNLFYLYTCTLILHDGKESTEYKIKPCMIDEQSAIAVFDLTAEHILPAMNTDYTVSLRLTNEYDEIWHASYPTSGFFCDNEPIPYKALQTVTLTPAARTFLETGMVCTYMKNYPVSYDVLWGLHFTSQKDPQKTLILHLKPLEITDKGQLVFKLTDKLACDFAPGEALTLSVRAVDPHCGMTYQSEPTEGYYFDLFGIEPPVQQGGEIVTPILPPKPSETKRSVSPLWFLAPICLAALATAAIFTLKGRKK